MAGIYALESRNFQYSIGTVEHRAAVKKTLLNWGESGTGRFAAKAPGDLDSEWVVNTDFKLDAPSNTRGARAMQLPTGLAPGYLRLIAIEKPPKTRQWAYGCTSETITDEYELTFPKASKITKIPEDVTFKGETLEYWSRYSLKGNVLSAVRHYSASHPQSVCGAKDDTERQYMLAVLKRDMRGQVIVRKFRHYF
jgi:hypothetical protein